MSENLIEIQGLSKDYGSFRAVDSLNLEIKKGEVFGLLGPNGAGKTTTTLMLLGLTDPTEGSARICGFDCTRNPVAVKRIVGYLPDNVGLYPDMTGRENLIFTGEMNGLSEEESRARAQHLLERVGMTEAADKKAGKYSRGMRQRLGIADVLMKDPEVIIMDEPTLGIDPEGMRELIALIKELSVKDGRTILLSSHQLYQVQQICDRVGIFVEGRLIASGTIEELGRQLQNEGCYFLDIIVEENKELLVTLLRKNSAVRKAELSENGTIHVETERDIRKEIFAQMLGNGITPVEVHQSGGDLAEIYHKYFEKAGENSGAMQRTDRGKKDGKRRLFRRKEE